MRALVVAHQLGHALMGEGDKPINLLHRAIEHARTTSRFNVYFGEGRDIYDVSGRVVHESIFNRNDGCYRCPSTQQGYTPFSTWTRGAAWIITGYPEQLEFLQTVKASRAQGGGWQGRGGEDVSPHGAGRPPITISMATPAWTAFLIGMTGPRNLHRLGDYRKKKSDPYNDWEPIDSSAAAIAAQGLIRLGLYLKGKGDRARRALSAGRTDRGGHLLRRTLSFNGPATPGIDSAFDLPPAQRLGLSAQGPQGSLWRIIDVGRLPCDGTGPPDQAPGGWRRIPDLLLIAGVRFAAKEKRGVGRSVA